MLNKELEKNGFIILRGLLNDGSITDGIECFNDNKVHYGKLSEFTKTLFQEVNSTLQTNIKPVKYRASNNNNSTDAGIFHRDLHNYDDNMNKPVQIYTCLSYLDPSDMELIPGSHVIHNISFLPALEQLNRIKKVSMEPGDILVINAMTIHRGVFNDKSIGKNRRLIQYFDVIDESREDLHDKILHARCNDSCNNTSSNIFKTMNSTILIGDIINFIGYFNVANGYGYKYKFLDKINEKGILYLSPEASQDRIAEGVTGWGENNMYVTLEKTRDLKPEDTWIFRKYSFVFGTVDLIVRTIMILIVCILIIRHIKNKQK